MGLTVSFGRELTNMPEQARLPKARCNLDTLPGIGPAIAQRIVEYREANGDFATIEEIMEVKGIGPATFEEIKELITVR